MSIEKPQNTSPNQHNNYDQSDELRKAILKLKEQGKIKDLPADIFGLDAVPVGQGEVSAAADNNPASNIPDKVKTSEDILQSDEEKARWSAVLSGWDNTPAKILKEEREKRKTAEIQALGEASDDAPDAKPENDDWGDWDEPSEPPAAPVSETPTAVLTAWETPEVIEKPEQERALIIRRQITLDSDRESGAVTAPGETPWALQQFFDGEIDLEVELQKRFSTIPIVSAVKFRTLGAKSQQRVATLTSTDGTATVIIDADVETKTIQLSFTFGSMVTLRYALVDLSDTDRSRWLELMRREKGGLAFLWGPTRWQQDYLICISRQYATKIYAFSPNHFESAIRLSSDVMEAVLNWLDEMWKQQPKDDASDAPLLTW